MATSGDLRNPELLSLWKAYWTHPSSMDGVSRLRQHDNFQKQINAYKRLLENAEKKFSKDSLYQMLRVLLKGLPQLKGSKRTPRDEDTVQFNISSLAKLREAVSAFQTRKRRGIQKEEVSHVLKYFQNFFKFVEGLAKYKQYFDDRIYRCLYEYFYDPSEDIQTHPSDAKWQRFGGSISKVHEVGVSDDADSGHYSDDLSPKQRSRLSPVRSDRSRFPPTGHDLPVKTVESDARERWSWAVRELYSTNKRWENLLTKEELDVVDFEEDSEKETLHYPGHDQFVLIFRLLPDIFAKSYKCLELAKIWWTQANKCLTLFSAKNRKTDIDFEDKYKSLKLKIEQLESDISKGQKNLEEFRVALKKTMSREKRAEELAADCEHLERLKIEAEEKYNQHMADRKQILHKFEYAIKGTSKYFELKLQLKEHDRRVSESYNALRVLRYQFEITNDDFLVEVEVRPNFIRFTDHVKEMVSTLKETLIKLKIEKRQCEKELALIKLNCDTMRSVMKPESDTSPSKNKVTLMPKYGSNKGRNLAGIRKERDNTYDVISSSTGAGKMKPGDLRLASKSDAISPVWSESERSEIDLDGHEADTEAHPHDDYTVHKYTRLLNAERKGRADGTKLKKRAKAKNVSRIPRPV